MISLLVAPKVKSLPAVQETWVRSLGWEDPLEKETATHSSILPGKSHGTTSPAAYSPWGHKESDMTERFHFAINDAPTSSVPSIMSQSLMWVAAVLDKSNIPFTDNISRMPAIILYALKHSISSMDYFSLYICAA